jgi:hypothetical protein
MVDFVLWKFLEIKNEWQERIILVTYFRHVTVKCVC